MMRRGIPCYYCVGSMYNPDNDQWSFHAWNIIKLNGNYYNCDPTWDDFYNEDDKYPSYISYEHFNTSDAQYTADGKNSMGRLRTAEGILLPACEADDLTYQALYGTQWELTLIDQLELDCTQVIDSVEAYFDFLYTEAVNRGIGSHSLTFLLKGKDTLDQIFSLSSDVYTYDLIDPVAQSIGYDGWSGMQWEYYYYPVYPYDEYFYIEFQLDFY